MWYYINRVDVRRVLSFECGGFIFFYFRDIMELRSLTTVHRKQLFTFTTSAVAARALLNKRDYCNYLACFFIDFFDFCGITLIVLMIFFLVHISNLLKINFVTAYNSRKLSFFINLVFQFL